MSVLDDLRSMEQRVAERLAELEPLVQEYNQLLAEAKRHNLALPGLDGSAARPRRGRAQAAAAPTTRRSAPTVKRQTPVRRNQRREQILKLVRQRPGITVAEIGKELKVDPTSLYRVVSALNRDGQIKKTGRQLRPA
jgi:DNA-binding transcriptional ArsR family regulator